MGYSAGATGHEVGGPFDGPKGPAEEGAVAAAEEGEEVERLAEHQAGHLEVAGEASSQQTRSLTRSAASWWRRGGRR